MAAAVICLILIIAGIFAFKSCLKRLSSGCCGSSSQPSVKKIKVRDKDPSHYPYHKHLKVDGMTCQSCSNRVENALNAMDGVWARVSLMEGEADVLMKENMEDSLLKTAVRDAGYTVYKIIND